MIVFQPRLTIPYEPGECGSCYASLEGAREGAKSFFGSLSLRGEPVEYKPNEWIGKDQFHQLNTGEIDETELVLLWIKEIKIQP